MQSFLLWLVLEDPPARAEFACLQNLKQIALAVINYESVNGHYPPPYIADESGVPMHSWRILILPYLGEEKLYEQYDFSKPWNHPDNLRLAEQMPSVFVCPSDSSTLSQCTTTYVAVVGPSTMWPLQGERRLQDIVDGLPETLLLIESTASRTHWMAPNDIRFNDIISTKSSAGTPLFSGNHKRDAVCVFADGHGSFLDAALSADTVKAMLTVNGGEKIDPDAVHPPPRHR